MNVKIAMVLVCAVGYTVCSLVSVVEAANGVGTTSLTSSESTPTSTVGGDSVSQDHEFLSALKWMVQNGLTKFSTPQEYGAYDVVTREQAAKFYSQFAINVQMKVIDMKKYCEFDDLAQADKSLQNAILESCMLVLFKGSDGNFLPKKTLTKAEAVTVLVRAVKWSLSEKGEVWRQSYYDEARKEWIVKPQTKMADMDKTITRYELALLLYRASVLWQ